MHIETLVVKNLRSIREDKFEFNLPRASTAALKCPNVTVLLGENGVGKSSVLRAIAMSVLAPVLEKGSGFVADGYVRKEPANTPAQRSAAKAKFRKAVATMTSTLRVHPQDGVEPSKTKTSKPLSMSAELRVIEDSEVLSWVPPQEADYHAIMAAQHRRETSAFFLVGYGSTRRVEQNRNLDLGARQKSRLKRYERVAGLFEEHYSLVPLSHWLPAYASRNPGRHKQVVNLINRLLPPSCVMQLRPVKTENGPEYMFRMNGVDVPFRGLSDGYRAYMGWIADMLYHLCMGAPQGRKLVENEGVVLIDEIDLHLHPEWQRTVLPTISQTLPNVQFIVTTHSPLVVGSLQRENITVLKASTAGTESKQLPESVHGKSAGQILLSPYFGLDSTRAPDIAEKLDEIRKKAERGDKKAGLAYLKMLAEGKLA